MNLTTWNPFREMEELLDRYKRSYSGGTHLGQADRFDITLPDWQPAVDISETQNDYVVRAELPGVKKEDVSVTIENGILTLRGDKKTQSEERENGKVHRVECSYGSFVRSFSLPREVEQDKIEAQYNDGILLLNIPKSAQAMPKTISIKGH